MGDIVATGTTSVDAPGRPGACSIVGRVAPLARMPRASPTSDDLRRRFAGELVVVEPLTALHEPGLIAAASDSELFRWLPVNMAASADAVRRWLTESLEAAAAGREVPYAILDANTGQVLGSTRFHELRFEHLRVEIGWTWLTRS